MYDISPIQYLGLPRRHHQEHVVSHLLGGGGGPRAGFSFVGAFLLFLCFLHPGGPDVVGEDLGGVRLVVLVLMDSLGLGLGCGGREVGELAGVGG